MSEALAPQAARPFARPLWLRVVSRWAESLACGSVELALPDGRIQRFDSGAPGPAARLEIRRPRMVRRMALGGEIGLAESYMDGDWTTPDLTAVIELGIRNHDALSTLKPSLGLRLLNGLRHALNANTRRGSRRNIAYHYDLGNAFYRTWLDETMTYSSAVFTDAALPLAEAQREKYRRVAEAIALSPGDRVLEIGCGWGGFAETAAQAGASLTCLTLSQEQARHTAARMADGGLSDRVAVRLEDYRDVQGRFDKIVAIEMFEAVGEKNWPAFFQTLRDRLAEGGRAALQVITVDDAVFDSYRRRVDFIQRYVFPGGMLPSPGALERAAEAAGLRVTSTQFFGDSYAETLKRWAQRFEAAWPEIAPLGFGERFRRMWRYYLHYCEAGFRAGATNVGHFVLERG